MGQVNFKTQEELETERLGSWRETAKVSAFQLRAALARAGRLGNVRQLMQGRNQDSDVALAWQFAGEVGRTSQLVSALGADLSLNEAQLDQIFKDAQSIEV